MGGKAFLQGAIVFKHIPEGIFGEDTSFQGMGELALLIIGKVLFPCGTTIIGGEFTEGVLNRVVLVEGIAQQAQRMLHALQILLHVFYSFYLFHFGYFIGCKDTYFLPKALNNMEYFLFIALFSYSHQPDEFSVFHL